MHTNNTLLWSTVYVTINSVYTVKFCCQKWHTTPTTLQWMNCYTPGTVRRHIDLKWPQLVHLQWKHTTRLGCARHAISALALVQTAHRHRKTTAMIEDPSFEVDSVPKLKVGFGVNLKRQFPKHPTLQWTQWHCLLIPPVCIGEWSPLCIQKVTR